MSYPNFPLYICCLSSLYTCNIISWWYIKLIWYKMFGNCKYLHRILDYIHLSQLLLSHTVPLVFDTYKHKHTYKQIVYRHIIDSGKCYTHIIHYFNTYNAFLAQNGAKLFVTVGKLLSLNFIRIVNASSATSCFDIATRIAS